MQYLCGMNTRQDTYLPGAATILFIALALLFLPWLGETLFNSKGEPREAIVAVSILSSGDWILPTNYGGDIPFKPPFLAWLIAGLAAVLNGGVVNEYISRLPSAIAVIAMVMAGYSWATSQRGRRFGLIFAFVTATCVEVFRAGIACRLDMVLTACIVCSMYLLFPIGEERTRHRGLRWLGAWVLLSCAVLTKGPVGSLLPCFVIGVYRLLRDDRFFPTLMRMLFLAIAALALPAWWFYEAANRGGQHFVDLMYEENLGRLFGTMSYDSHVKPIWYNFATLAAGTLPWIVAALFAVFSWRKWHRTPLRPAGLFSLVSVVLIVGFYCIPESKRSVYLLPAYPFVAYALASIIDSDAARRPMRAFAWFISAVAVLAPAAFVWLQFNPMEPIPAFEASPWWAYAVLALPVASGIAWFSNRHSPVGHMIVTVWALMVAYAAAVAPAILNQQSDFKAVERLTEGNNTVLSLDHTGTHRLYTLNFYLNDNIRTTPTIAEASNYPSGTIVLISEHADTTGLWRNFNFEPLLDRSCDHRDRLGIAIRK